MSKKKASELLEERLGGPILFEQKAKGWEHFDIKQFQKDAKRVSETFTEEDEALLSKRNYL